MAEKKGRGFAAMDRAKQREIASKGGKAAHQKGTAHEFTREEARAAGRKGGQAAHEKGTAHKFTPEEARAAGRKGGQAAHERSRARKEMPLEDRPSPAPAQSMPDMNGSAVPMPSGAGQPTECVVTAAPPAGAI